MNAYFDLFITFAKIGGVTFGGGYTMLPILQKEVVEKKKWVTAEEVMDYYAISQCTPGIIAVNTAIFIGYKYKKLPGGIMSALGVTFPSLVIIIAIALFLQNFMEDDIVARAFTGINVAVAALVFHATAMLYKKGVTDLITFILFAGCLVITLLLDLSPIWLVLAAATIGIICKMREEKG